MSAVLTTPLKLRPFREYQVDVFGLALADPTKYTVHRARLWRMAPIHLKQWVYYDLIELFRRECEAWGFEAAKAFPEPPAMAEVRAAHPQRTQEAREPTTETPAQAPR